MVAIMDLHIQILQDYLSSRQWQWRFVWQLSTDLLKVANSIIIFSLTK